MSSTVLIIFAVVYLGMILGEFPGLALDRTGVALLGAIALLATGCVHPRDAWVAIDVPTIGLLFGLMVVSAQFRLGGFYTRVTRRIADADVSPTVLLALIVGLSGVLSAVLANDIVCLAVAPLLVEGCARRRLDPVPYLLALACASNVGSAATLIGNPQNMLIGARLHLSFAGYLGDAAVPAILGLVAVWAVVHVQFAGRWIGPVETPVVHAAPFHRWHSIKAVLVTLSLIAAFLLTDWPREVVALAAAGVLLMSRRMASRSMLALVDWHLLILFMSLFVLNHALVAAGWLDRIMSLARDHGLHVARPAWLFAITVALSNIVSNVPAVMLLLPVAVHPKAGAILALSSTLAGNLLVVGSIANLIVFEQARRLNVRITWRQHVRVGAPVTLITLACAALWLWLRRPIE